jgi:hypothetical protein
MGYALANRETYTEMMCGECGLVFYIPELWRKDRELTGKGFYCPNGHARIYKESLEVRLRREIADKERALEWEKCRANNLAKRFNRLRKRVAAGVCPHCQRTFKQLAEHMKTKHPEETTRTS